MTSSPHEPSAVPSRLTGPDAHPGDDPYLWLEDVEGEAALAHVRAQNARAEAALTASPRFAELRDQILEVLDSDDPIACRMKVSTLIESLPGYGKAKAAKIMDELGISATRRVKGLGARQREQLIEALSK